MNPKDLSSLIKKIAKQNGIVFCGISKAEFLENEAPRLESFLKNNFQGKMSYLENHFDKRLDPTKLVEGAKTVISFLYNYFPENELPNKTYKIAKYAYGKDYHFVFKEKLIEIWEQMTKEIGNFDGRIFVDSAPVMERAWAEKSGLGWIGKHGLLINKNSGSFYFLGEMIIDLECEPDSPIKDYCGTCTACVDACPTDAILPNKTLNASKCISYLNIELKDKIPNEFQHKLNNWLFGCDICQDVCPWNRFSKPNNEPNFSPINELKNMKNKDWEELSELKYQELFKNTAIKRSKFEKLKSTIEVIKGIN